MFEKYSVIIMLFYAAAFMIPYFIVSYFNERQVILILSGLSLILFILLVLGRLKF